MRAPSQVQQRKRLLEARKQQQQRQKPTQLTKKKSKSGTDKTNDTSKDNETPDIATANDMPESGDFDSPHPSTNDAGGEGPPLPPVEQIERQNPQHLAAAVRKHFNAQQLNEAETIARFIYVARSSASRDHVNTQGSAGDGHGFVMGCHGREVRRGEGGEPGFRLRFVPG